MTRAKSVIPCFESGSSLFAVARWMRHGARRTSTSGGSRKVYRIPPRRNKDERKLKGKSLRKKEGKGKFEREKKWTR